jgi:hypothetical protein
MSSFDPRQRPPATRSGWHVRVCEPNGTERLEDRLDLRQWRSYEALWLLPRVEEECRPTVEPCEGDHR